MCENCVSRVFFSVPLLALLERLASVCHHDRLQLLPPQHFRWKTVPLQTPPTNRLTPPLCAAHKAHTGVLDCCGGWCGFIPALPACADTSFLHTCSFFILLLPQVRSSSKPQSRDNLPSKHLIFTVYYLTYISALLLKHSE